MAFAMAKRIDHESRCILCYSNKAAPYHPAYESFVVAMKGACYGSEALNDAWEWFKSGWVASKPLREPERLRLVYVGLGSHSMKGLGDTCWFEAKPTVPGSVKIIRFKLLTDALINWIPEAVEVDGKLIDPPYAGVFVNRIIRARYTSYAFSGTVIAGLVGVFVQP